MKNRIFHFTPLLAILIILNLVNTGCNKKDNGTTSVDSCRFYLHLHTDLDSNEAVLGPVYTSSTGRKISISKAQLFVSNIQLVKQDGTIYPCNGVVLLKTVVQEEYYVATVPVATYKSVNFQVGLDAATNGKTPTSTDSSLYHPEMWWTSPVQPNGFIFLNFQGSIDTTTNATSTIAQMQPFIYELGSKSVNTSILNVTMPDHSKTFSNYFSPKKDETFFVHIICDYYKLFNGINLSQSGNLMINTPAQSTIGVGSIIVANIPSMFIYEE